MVNSIVFTNQSTGESITVHRAQAPYVLESIDWDSPSVTPTTYRVPFQIGETLNGIVVGTRKPLLTGYVVADTMNESYKHRTWKEYYAQQELEIQKNKQKLNKVFNVYQDILISADGYFLKVRPTRPVKYATDNVSNNEIMCMFSVEFECYEEPLFYKKSKQVNLATIKGMFKFPMTLTEDATDEFVAFGEIERGIAKELLNDGDIPIGCTITIEAKGGSVVSPKVYDVSTGKGIALSSTTITDGQRAIIVTEIGKENAILHNVNGENTSLIGALSIESEYFQLNQGSNFYIASATSGNENMYVSVNYTEKYFNIETM